MNYNISIIGGCGHVGLPLGIALGGVGHTVNLIDINENSINTVNEGKMPFLENGADEILDKLVSAKKLHATSSRADVAESDFVIFVTGTPVDEHLNPKVSAVLDVVNEYVDFLNPNSTVILRSTNYPGTFNLVENILKENKNVKKLAFCPERILQGKAVEEIENLPQIISSNCDEAFESARDLFKTITKEVIRLTPVEAEFAKLITNSWRYLEFSIANQFYMIAEENGIDFFKVFNSLKHGYDRASTFKMPGLAAGPCLFKDTMQLSAFANNQFFLGHSAMLINEGLPRFLVRQLEDKFGNLNGKNICILGMTFKANNDDIRDSLSFKIKKELTLKLANVIESDVYLPETLDFKEALDKSDAVILGVPHREYINLDINKPYIDCWGVWDKKTPEVL